ncbi:MAG: Sec-independent protein translocase subunit TatA/TatB [Candidatus Eiseniibacteriota bacterium]
MGIGGWELFLIFVIALLVFGPRKIPELARGLGKGLREIRRLSTELHREIHLAEAEDEEQRLVAPPPSPADAERRD